MVPPSEANPSKQARLHLLAQALRQAESAEAIHQQVGSALKSLLAPDQALLKVAMDSLVQAVEFDENGAPQSFHPESELNAFAEQALASGKALVQLSGAKICLIAVPFPPARPVGVLSVRWREEAEESELKPLLASLQQIGELATTAFVNISLRQSMEAFNSTIPRKG